MDRVTENLLQEFSNERGVAHFDEGKRFEHFASFVTVSRHYAETFDTEDILVGHATGIDAIAIIVNGVLVTDIDSIEDADIANDLDVTFIFVQADRGTGFDASKIGNFGFAVLDYFSEKPTLPRNDRVSASAAVMTALFKRSSKFKKGNPVCRLYMVTTGTWTNDTVLEGRGQAVASDLRATNLFREVTFTPLGRKGYKNSIGRRRTRSSEISCLRKAS